MFDFEVVTTVEEAQFLLDAPVVAFDIETDAREYHWDSNHKRGTTYAADISHISFYAGSDHPAVVFTTLNQQDVYTYLTLEHNEFNEPYIGEQTVEQFQHYWSDDVYDFLLGLFSQDKTFVAHNLIFDARQVYGKLYIPIPAGAHFYDTMTQAVTGMWAAEKNDLLSLYRKYYTLNPDQLTWLDKMKRNRKRLHTLDPHDVQVYAAWDSVAAYQVWEAFQQEDKYPGYEDQLLTDLDYTKLGVRMSVEGVRVDLGYAWNHLLDLRQQWVGAVHDLGLTVETEGLTRKRSWLEDRIINSSEQPSDKDIERYALRTDKGAWSFNKKALNYYLENNASLNPLKILKELEVEIAGIEEFIRHAEYDGKVHSIMARAAVTGRNTSGSPNLQNIDFKRFAGVLIGDTDDHQLIELDYSNAENWALAGYTADSALARACAAADFHSEMARSYFGEDLYQSLTDTEWHNGPRKKGKAITFGTAYGMGPSKLADSLNISLDEAYDILENKARAFPDVERTKSKASKFAEKYGYTILWDGRRVKIQEYDGKVKGYTAINSLNQGGVASLVARAMLRIERLLDEKYPRSRIALQVHDSIIVSLHKDDYPTAVQEIIEIMGSVIPDDFNNRTIPACRWLVTLDNRENSRKWGYRVGHDYLLPLDEYVNRWGVHKYSESENEAPTWINKFGYGEGALQHELELLLPYEEEIEEKPAEFNWVGFYQAVRFLSLSMTPVNGVPFKDWVEGTPAQRNCLDFIHMLRNSGVVYGEIEVNEPFTWGGFERRVHALARLTIPMRFVNGKVYEFPEAMTIREELFKRGYDVAPLYEVLDRINELVAYTGEVEV